MGRPPTSISGADRTPSFGEWIRRSAGDGRPAVALESAVITHGLPRAPLRRRPAAADPLWDPDSPTNLELARQLIRVVAAEGARPEVMGVVRGCLCIGMSDSEIASLAADELATKASGRDVAAVLARGSSAGLTVAGTLLACRASAGDTPIRVFATGGIGGAHHDWQRSADVSADLRALAESPVCVVCAGAKSILDLPATLEMLDSLGVPVVGFGTDAFPRFISPPDPSLPLPCRVDDVAAVASMCRLHWGTLQQRSAVLLANPAPPEFAIDGEELASATRSATEAVARADVRGAAVTPFLLSEIARRTAGRSIDANIALLIANARVAARVALALVR